MLFEVPADVVVLHGEPASGRLLGDVRALAGSGPTPAVLLLTGPTDVETTLLALLAGASGHVWLSASASHVVHVVRTVADGSVVVPGRIRSELGRYLIRRPDRQDVARLGVLNERELRVLALLADGHSSVEIAQDLVVSPATVKKYLSQLLRKLGLRDRLQAGLYGYRVGLGRMAQADRSGDRFDPPG
jgi:DNA-binding NarL/FixJ family response regulator